MNQRNEILLRSLIKETLLMELEITPGLEAQIEAFAELSDEIDRATAHLNKLKTKFSYLEDTLRPVMEDLDEQSQSAIQTKKYLLTIKRKGYDRTNVKYKEAFEQSLTKVNTQTRRILEEVLESTKSTTRVVSKLGVQPVTESNILQRIVGKLRGIWGKLTNKLKRNKKDLNTLLQLAKKIA